MRKIATITWITYCNFGTFLQAYALQNTIKKLGYETSVIDDSSHLSHNTSIQRTSIIYKVRKILSKIKNFKYKIQLAKSNKLYSTFKNKYISVDYRQDLTDISKDYDAFVIGSDQIWHPTLFNPYFYAEFTSNPKIAYAPSLGCYSLPENIKNSYRNALRDYKAISVREKQGADLLQETLNRPIEVVLDPTLLLTKNEWIKLTSSDSPSKNKYILAYFLTYNEDYLRWARLKAHKEGKKLVIFSTNKQMRKFADIFYTAGPSEFLSAINNADLVITDSFHATIFSILFEKEFFTCQRFKSNDKMNQNSRLENLFRIIGVADRFLAEEDIQKQYVPSQLDYNKIKENINEERRKSISFLENSLNSIWN